MAIAYCVLRGLVQANHIAQYGVRFAAERG